MRVKSTPVSSLKQQQQQSPHCSASRTRKKHKRLDAICEKAYNLNHAEQNGRVPKDEEEEGSSELRRSTRVRRAPVLLDASPPPPKKRQKVGRTRGLSAEKNGRLVTPRVKEDESEDFEYGGTPGSWRSRLRSRGRTGIGKKEVWDSPRGKRKLFAEIVGESQEGKSINEELMEVQGETVNKMELQEVGSSAEVKLMRQGRDEAADASGDEEKVGDSTSDGMDGNFGDETGDEGNDCRDGISLVVEMHDLCEKESTVVNGMDLVVEEEKEVSHSGQLEAASVVNDCDEGTQDVEQEECVKEETADISISEAKGDAPDCQDVNMVTLGEKLTEHGNNPEADKTKIQHYSEKLDFSRIKEGRRCGLCGGSTDGKPPKRLRNETGESENEASNGSSATDETNYDIWDGFGDEPGWLGRLLGPINDRYGIAGTWVHQQCAVWSPECFQVYFAGVGCLKNVRAALCRGRVLKCSRCGRPGATIGCRVDRCPKTYHLPCARAEGCIFDHRKFLIACIDHRHIFQPHGSKKADQIKKMKTKKMKMELRKLSNDAWRKDIEAEEKWLENCGEDEEFLKRESKRLHRDLLRISPVYIGGTDTEDGKLFPGWESVAGLQDVIRCMKEVIILPLLYPEFFENLGITPPRGVLLHGYPGTGKTLVVRSLIGSCARGDKRIAYFARKGADCLGKYVGDAERQLRLLFQVAEKCQPSIIFFDEIDGLAPCRTKHQDQTHSSVVSTLLALLDGLKSRGSVIVIGATNRPDAVDPALRRPGRFDREIYFPLPSLEDRAAILSLHTQKWPKPVSGSLLRWIASKTAGFAGADLQALCTQAAIIALKRSFPLQEVLSAAGNKPCQGERVPLPSFAVEEKDWLEALSSSQPPCSRREAGIAANDIASSPLPSHIIPCLLRPLSTLLVSLHLDGRLWLPPALSKAAAGVKILIFSTLDKRRLPDHMWRSHVHFAVQEAAVVKEIERELFSAGIVVGGSGVSSDSFTVGGGENHEHVSSGASMTYNLGSRTSSSNNMPFSLRTKSGYRVLISGTPRSGQRHLASCLLHCYYGNVDVQKIDLATISQEGHGDVVQGLTRILMKCANVGPSVLFMPRIDLWAVRTYELSSDDEGISVSLDDHSPAGKARFSAHSALEMNITSHVKRCEPAATDGCKRSSRCPSHVWSSFIEQVEAICVNTSLVILATSDVPHADLPSGIRQFFGSDVHDSGQSTSEHALPRFSVLMDRSINHEMVVQKSAAELLRNTVTQFVQLIYKKSHISPIHESETSAPTGDQAGGTCNLYHPSFEHDGRTQNPDDSLPRPSPLLNKRNLKGKSSLMIGISAFGYQILVYPHFAELCWITSKLKEGPVADISGPWKGWPFNSCIARPYSTVEKMSVSCNPGNLKCKEGSLLVRGIAAVGLLAYRGVYVSAKQVSFEIRRVLELLVGQISSRIQAGKDRFQYARILSQVSHLEDMVNSWAYSLQSLDADAQVTMANPVLTSTASSGNNLQYEEHKPLISRSSLETGVLEAIHPESAAANVDQTSCYKENCDHGLPNSEKRVGLLQDDVPENVSLSRGSTLKEHLCSSSAADNLVVKTLSECNDTDPMNLPEAHGDSAIIQDESLPLNHLECSSSADAIIIPQDVPFVSRQMDGTANPGSSEVDDQLNGFSSKDSRNLSVDDMPGSDVTSAGKASSKNLGGPTNPAGVCLYRCCSTCLNTLHEMMRQLLIPEAGLDSSCWNVEDVHEAVSSVSADLASRIRQDFAKIGSLSGADCGNSMPCPDSSTSRHPCRVFNLSTPEECARHSVDGDVGETVGTTRTSQLGHSFEFVFRDGVLIAANHDDNSPCHCKFRSLCLCSLVELISSNKWPPE